MATIIIISTQRNIIFNIKEEASMESLIYRLNTIPNSYYEFIDSVVSYASASNEHYTLLMCYLDSNPTATPSGIIKFISLQPDFFDDEVPAETDELVC